MTQRTTLASHDFRIPRRSGDGQGIGAGAPHRGQLGRFHLENLSIVLREDRRAMPRQRTDHSRIVYVFPDDFPQQLVRFQEESGLPWAELNRRLDTDPETVRRWRDKGARPSTRHMMALAAMANSLGLDHIPLEFRPDADDGPTAPTRGPGACLRATLGTSRTGAGTT